MTTEISTTTITTTVMMMKTLTTTAAVAAQQQQQDSNLAKKLQSKRSSFRSCETSSVTLSDVLCKATATRRDAGEEEKRKREQKQRKIIHTGHSCYSTYTCIHE